MKTIHFTIAIVSLIVVLLTGCNKKEGCTNPSAKNYDPSAKVDDGSCIFETLENSVDIRAAWIGEYTSTRILTINERTDTTQTTLKIYAVNSCDNLLHIIEPIIGHNCYVTCKSDGTFTDTLINGDSQNRPIVRGNFDGSTVNIEYIWGQKNLHIIFSGSKTQTYDIGVDYREGWLGDYEGRIRCSLYSIDTTYNVSFSIEKYMDCGLRLNNIVPSSFSNRDNEIIEYVYEDGKIEVDDDSGHHIIKGGTIYTDSIHVYFVDGVALGFNSSYTYDARRLNR